MTTAFTVGFMLSLALKSALVLAGAAVAAQCLRRSSAATRHLVWVAALAGLLLLPLLSGAGLSWRPPLAARLAAVPAQAVTILDVVAQGPGLQVSAAAVAWWLWAIGFAVVLAQTAFGLVRIERLLRHAQPFEGYGRGVWLSDRAPVPLVCGLWRPQVVLPAAAPSWPASRLGMVLTHERMHIARRDTRTYLMGTLACALYWPNPLVWWAANCLRREAEQACDDGVLIQGERATAYAGALVEIVQGLRSSDHLPEGGLAMGRVSELEDRLKALLKSGLRRRRATPLLVAGVSLLSLVILLPLAAFQAPAPQGGGIWGVVRDASGALVPKARVTIALAGSNRKEFAVTANTGQFALQPLPEGTYSVEVAKPGFAKLVQQGIAVKAGLMTEVQAILNVGQVSETIDVKAERPAPSAESPAGSPQRLQVGGNVQATKLVHMERPAYPRDCKAEGVEGTVLLHAVIGMDGSILNLQQVNQLVDPRLAAAATEAVKQWRYEPTLLNGNPVEVITDIAVNFTLAN